MAAGDIVVYDQFKLKQMSGVAGATAGVGVIDLAAATMKLMLCTSVYTPAPTTDGVLSVATLSANEVTPATSYVAGGPIVAVAVSDTAGVVRVKIGSDVVIAQDAGGFTNARYWVLYEYSGVDANDKVVCYGDFGADKSVVTGSLTIDFENTNGGTLFEY